MFNGLRRGFGRHRGAGGSAARLGLPISAMSRSACAIQKSRSASMEALTLAICVRASASSSNTPISMPL
jgi:hypothetical protein